MQTQYMYLLKDTNCNKKNFCYCIRCPDLAERTENVKVYFKNADVTLYTVFNYKFCDSCFI